MQYRIVQTMKLDGNFEFRVQHRIGEAGKFSNTLDPFNSLERAEIAVRSLKYKPVYHDVD